MIAYLVSTFFSAVRTCRYHILKQDISKFKRRAGKRIMNIEETNEWLKKAIGSEKPFMVARYGAVELGITNQYFAKKIGIKKKIPKSHRQLLCNNAGFFPDIEKYIDSFCEMVMQDSIQVDLLGCWNMVNEDFFIKKCMNKDVNLCLLYMLEPYYFSSPWTESLKGKKVLVVHPFAETIMMQYQNREKIFENESILPEFTLITIKAVQSIGGKCDEYGTWFDALQSMKNKIDCIDFDVALIGCGAYGFHLAAHIKKNGRKAIHLGGALQLLFGIKGKRWDDNPFFRDKLYNEYWVRPSNDDKPAVSEMIENGCYW